MARGNRLTPRQRLVLDHIQHTIKLTGRPPTLRELGERLGIASTNGVRDHLKALEDKGYIRRDERSARGIRVVSPRVKPHGEPAAAGVADDSLHIGPAVRRARDAVRGHAPVVLEEARRAREHSGGVPTGGGSVVVPVLGRVAAGVPILAEQNVESHLALDAGLLRDGNVFALRVRGDSMRDAGILDGDYVFVRQQADAQPRDIVVALLGDETTVKRFVPEPGGAHVRLEPENPAYSPIVVGRDDARLTILGKVCAVLRTI